MRPIPLDDEDWGEPFHKVVVSGPSGDLINDEIQPVEAYVGPVAFSNGNITPAFHIKIKLEEADLLKIAHGLTEFWLILYGTRIQPFALEMR